MSRIFNFSAGPATLPVEVLEQARDELVDWRGSGMSVMEMSHRGKEFMSIAAEAEKDLRALMSVPDNYKILFLQGGASTQFAMVPLNLMASNKKADYLLTGHWSKKAVAEGKRYGEINIAVNTTDSKFTTIPKASDWSLSTDAAYVHYTPNETIAGVEFQDIPQTGDVPLVADMSSTILSRPIDVSRFGIIYAGAQKNIGPAGLTLVIVRDDLIGHAGGEVPEMLNYKTHADNDSMYNTPPTFAWYIAGLVFKWVVAQGGVKAMGDHNSKKAGKLYNAIDSSDGFYRNPVDKPYRSLMNVPFVLKDDALDKEFLAGAEQAGLAQLKGHRSVGGMRASIYNAMPEAGIDALINYMQDFRNRKG
jgi:phosphoserine aminotransferase